MDIMSQRYRPYATGIADTRPENGVVQFGDYDRTRITQNPRVYERDYTATEKLDLIAWLNERDAGYPTATFSAAKA